MGTVLVMHRAVPVSERNKLDAMHRQHCTAAAQQGQGCFLHVGIIATLCSSLAVHQQAGYTVSAGMTALTLMFDHDTLNLLVFGSIVLSVLTFIFELEDIILVGKSPKSSAR